MRYLPLSKELLAGSLNAGIQELVKNNFIYDDADFRPNYNPAKQLYEDVIRGVQFNDLNYQFPEFIMQIQDSSYVDLNALIFETFPTLNEKEVEQHTNKILNFWEKGEKLSKFLLETYVDAEFEQRVLAVRRNRHASLIKVLNQQFPGKINGVSCAKLLLKYYSQGPQSPSVAPFLIIAALKGLGVEAENQSIKIYSCVEKGKYKVYYETNVPRMRVTCLRTFKKIHIKGSKWKFELTHKGFEFVEAFAYGPNVFDMLMGAMPDKLKWFHSYPLSMRLKEAYKRAPISNPFKFVCEFLPHCFESLATWSARYLLENMPNKSVMKNFALRFGVRLVSYVAIGLLDIVYVASKWCRLLLSRISSPIRSHEEANKIHPVLGLISMLVTVTLMVAVGVLVSPLMTQLGLNYAANWFIAHTGAVGSALQSAGTQIAALIGESVSGAMAGSMCFLAGLFAMVLVPLSGYLPEEVDQVENEDDEQPEDEPKVIPNSSADIAEVLRDEYKKSHEQPPNPHAYMEEKRMDEVNAYEEEKDFLENAIGVIEAQAAFENEAEANAYKKEKDVLESALGSIGAQAAVDDEYDAYSLRR